MECYSQVLEVSSRELGVRGNLNLSIADILDLNDIAEVSDTAVNLDLVLKELLEGGDVEDLVAGGLRSVNDELSFSSVPILLRTSSTHTL
jgi:hypothetical protein